MSGCTPVLGTPDPIDTLFASGFGQDADPVFNPGPFGLDVDPPYAVWLTERATDYLRGDIPVKGGITTMLKAAHLAQAFQMTYEVHHGGNSLNNMAQLHFACAIPNTTYFEVLLPHGAHKYGLLNDIEIGRDGLAHCPQVPGIGAVIDFDLIQRKKLTQLA
jgi:L-alanine-DL-glutamate epimerase-like enolase superfamily enzyme